jgi:Mn2+/Fe2+ NRAMP family transporter
LLVLAHPNAGDMVHHTFVPSIHGGATSTAVLLIIAIVGTTVAPWQLFFQQSNIIDKRITPRWINYERTDTVVGAFVVVIGAGALICVTAFAFAGTHDFGKFSDAGAVASELAHELGSTSGTFFAIVLLNASLIGAAAVTLATSYAFGDVFGAKHSLNRGPLDAKLFYASFSAMVMAAAGVVLIPGAPLGLITTSVQALAGVLLPSATVFLLLLCNDREVLGPWCNAPWLNALASVIVGVLVELSLILMVSTMFPSVDVPQLFLYMTVALVAILAVACMYALRNRLPANVAEVDGGEQESAAEDRRTWTMPPLALLERPVWSPGRKASMLLLRGYLLVAVLLLIVKTVQLGH